MSVRTSCSRGHLNRSTFIRQTAACCIRASTVDLKDKDNNGLTEDTWILNSPLLLLLCSIEISLVVFFSRRKQNETRTQCRSNNSFSATENFCFFAFGSLSHSLAHMPSLTLWSSNINSLSLSLSLSLFLSLSLSHTHTHTLYYLI